LWREDYPTDAAVSFPSRYSFSATYTVSTTMRPTNIPSLPAASLLFILLSVKTLAAPTSCEYACHPLDQSGHKLISSPHAIAYDGPWSIFDCVYYTTGLSENPRMCHYNKATGLLAVTSAIATQCPPAAIKCADTTTPQFSAMDNPEQPIWVVKGNTELYYKMNPPDAPH